MSKTVRGFASVSRNVLGMILSCALVLVNVVNAGEFEEISSEVTNEKMYTAHSENDPETLLNLTESDNEEQNTFDENLNSIESVASDSGDLTEEIAAAEDTEEIVEQNLAEESVEEASAEETIEKSVDDAAENLTENVTGEQSEKFTETAIAETQKNLDRPSKENEKSFFYDESDVGQGWKIGTVVVIVLAYILAIIGFVRRVMKLGVISSIVAVLLTVAVIYWGLAGFVAMVWNAVVVIGIGFILFIIASIYSKGKSGSNSKESVPKSVEIVSVKMINQKLDKRLIVNIVDSKGYKSTREIDMNIRHLIGYTNKSVTTQVFENYGGKTEVFRLKGNSIISARLVNY